MCIGEDMLSFDVLYRLLGRCVDPRNLSPSVGGGGGDAGRDFSVDLEDEEFVRLLLLLLLPPPFEEPRRDDGDVISLSSCFCREELRFRNLRRINDGMIVLLFDLAEGCVLFLCSISLKSK